MLAILYRNISSLCEMPSTDYLFSHHKSLSLVILREYHLHLHLSAVKLLHSPFSILSPSPLRHTHHLRVSSHPPLIQSSYLKQR